MQEDRSSNAGCRSIRLFFVAAVVLFGVIRYFMSTQVNPTTGQKQHVGSFTPEKEIALGLEATPQMVQQFGGESEDSPEAQLVEDVGQELVRSSQASKSPYTYDFHLLNDNQTINAFALPGGQVFITRALLSRLKTRGQLAGVLGHEIGHVVERHGAQQMAKQELTQTLSMAAVIGTYDPSDRNSISKQQMILLIGSMVNMKFGRNDELEADKKGVEFMSQAGYTPKAMISVMEVLKSTGGSRQPEFFSTHPNPDNRIGKIEDAIRELFPSGIPSNLRP